MGVCSVAFFTVLQSLVNCECATIPDISLNISGQKTLADRQAAHDKKYARSKSNEPELTAAFPTF
jgi:hypothetical protein